MTAQEIADRALTQPLTAERLKKLEGLAARAKVDLAAVLVLLPADVQAQIAGLSK